MGWKDPHPDPNHWSNRREQPIVWWEPELTFGQNIIRLIIIAGAAAFVLWLVGWVLYPVILGETLGENIQRINEEGWKNPFGGWSK